MKLQHIAAATALLVAAGAANAAVDGGASGNGSLVLIAYDKIGGTTTAAVFDLGITLNDFQGNTSGTSFGATGLSNSSLSWDFTTGAFSINGVASTAYGANDWSAAWTKFLANSDAADRQYVITAFDTVGVNANVRALVTGIANPTAATLTSQNNSLFSTVSAVAGGKAKDIFTPIANKGTIGTAANGAFTYASVADGTTNRAGGYVMAGDAFANNWNNGNLLQGETLLSNTTSLWMLDGTGTETKAAGIVSLSVDGTLSYTVTSVPEPTTYALLVAGLAVVGFAARRRAA